MLRQPCLLLLCLLLAPVACDDGVSSASRLQRLRLLAVQAEPPSPRFGDYTVLRPLVYLPPGETVSYAWSWCPVPTDSQNGYRCPVDQAQLDAIAARAGLDGVPPLALGAEESVTFKNPFPATLLASLCSGDSTTTQVFTGGIGDGRNSQVYNCSVATLPLQVMLTIRGSTTDTGVVSLRLPIDDTPGNQNPVLTGIAVMSPEPMRVLDEAGTVTVPRDTKVRLRAGLDPSQAETYLDRQVGPNDEYVRDQAGQFVLAPTRERINLSWFTEGGGFEERTTSWGVSDLDSNGQPLSFEAATDNPWTTPKADDYGATSSVLLVVARDSRGGVAWTRGVTGLENGQ
jgi:hypothetical protein